MSNKKICKVIGIMSGTSMDGLDCSFIETDGKNYVKYQVLGKNNVAVPTHFFKVMVGELDNHHLGNYHN